MKKLLCFILIIVFSFTIMACSKDKDVPLVEEVNLSQVLRQVEAFGLVKAEAYKDIMIDFPARVKDILVKEGEAVKKKDPIVILDISEYLLEIENKEKELTIAELEYQRIQKNIQGLYLEDLSMEKERLSNNLSFLKELYASSLQELLDYERLYEAGAISQQEFTGIKRSVEERKNEITNIEYTLQQLGTKKDQEQQHFLLQEARERDQLKIQGERLQQMKGTLENMKAKLEKSFIEENVIVCDFENAIIYDISYAAGNTISPSENIFRMISLDDLIIEANVVEEFISDVKVGDPVRIVPVADRSKEYEGEVISISRMAFARNGETVIPVRIAIHNIDDFLLPNYNVDVFIKVNGN